ncbi:MAG: DEAD/DEAH box helicase [Bacteroidia bacterium]|nr:DEAD/DEAH box helicase [Bacteroidia bacterium]
MEELGFETPSEIQQKAIPELLEKDTDFIGLAQTGTGKTAAFGLPLLEKIDPADNHTQALILAPTRELGKQIAEQLEIFSKYQDKVNVLAVYGGAAIVNQIKALKKTQHIIIATPGRLIDLIKRKAVNLNRLDYLVLDEADEMLNMGFKDELNEILSYTPADKLTWLFSATMPNEIKKIINKYMDDPIEVRIDVKNVVNKDIQHQFTLVKVADKTDVLTRFLDADQDMRGIVFCRTRRDTQHLAEELQKVNYRADALHGDLSQAQRDRVMKRFKSYSLQVLIATDVAARGIDVNDLTHVFHYSMPDDPLYYTHRAGRTGRAGKKGISLVFVNGREHGKLNRFQQELGINFEKVLIPNTENIIYSRLEKWCNTILNKKTDENSNPELMEKIIEFFGDVSKEELLEKFAAIELEKLNLDKGGDLNKGAERDDRGRRDKGRGGRDRGRGGRGGRDSRGGRGRDSRGGGRDRRKSSASAGDDRRGPSDRRKKKTSRKTNRSSETVADMPKMRSRGGSDSKSGSTRKRKSR